MEPCKTCQYFQAPSGDEAIGSCRRYPKSTAKGALWGCGEWAGEASDSTEDQDELREEVFRFRDALLYEAMSAPNAEAKARICKVLDINPAHLCELIPKGEELSLPLSAVARSRLCSVFAEHGGALEHVFFWYPSLQRHYRLSRVGLLDEVMANSAAYVEIGAWLLERVVTHDKQGPIRARRLTNILKQAQESEGGASSSPTKTVYQLPTKINRGFRYITLVQYGLQLKERGLSQWEVRALLSHANTTRGLPPLNVNELHDVLKAVKGEAPYSIRTFPEGQRWGFLCQSWCHDHDGRTDEEVAQWLFDLNRRHCRPPLDQDELNDVIDCLTGM